ESSADKAVAAYYAANKARFEGMFNPALVSSTR
ncbi:glycine/betaine ABC transporter substrate-binding protein, partial [Pseudomonas reactans]|nr:glycine/betaine ABC transporter substrate-binding protein [Pseudomonas reactans]